MQPNNIVLAIRLLCRLICNVHAACISYTIFTCQKFLQIRKYAISYGFTNLVLILRFFFCCFFSHENANGFFSLENSVSALENAVYLIHFGALVMCCYCCCCFFFISETIELIKQVDVFNFRIFNKLIQ